MPPKSRAYGKVSSNSPGAPAQGYTSQYTGKKYNQTQVQVSITWNSSYEAYDVNVPFQPNFIEFIKAKIPGSDRDWRPQSKIWVVKEPWLPLLVTLATELWGASSVIVTSRQAVEDAEREQQAAMRQAMLAMLPEKEKAIFELLELVPPKALKALYRAAAIELHPDKQAGDNDKMARLNAAWANLEKFLT